MFTECRDSLKKCLIQSGAGKNIYMSEKLLRASAESRVSAVLFDDDALQKSKNKRIYTDVSGNHKRRQIFERSLTFSVIIGEYSIEKVQECYDKFLLNIPPGIYVNGNYVDIEPTAADWIDNEDSVIRAKCAVQLKVVCKGGIYRDTDFAKAGSIELTIEKEAGDGKEGIREPGGGI